MSSVDDLLFAKALRPMSVGRPPLFLYLSMQFSAYRAHKARIFTKDVTIDRKWPEPEKSAF